jgi:hypothetical protein
MSQVWSPHSDTHSMVVGATHSTMLSVLKNSCSVKSSCASQPRCRAGGGQSLTDTLRTFAARVAEDTHSPERARELQIWAWLRSKLLNL